MIDWWTRQTIHVTSEPHQATARHFAQLTAIAFVWLATIAIVAAQEQDSAPDREFFEARIRPFLVSECYDCHAAESQESNLRLDDRARLLRGGDSGPALVPGDAEASLLFQSIAHTHPSLKMPEGRPQLPQRVIDDFRKWIDSGAFDPRDEPADAIDAGSSWDQVFMARRDANAMFSPIQDPPSPSTRDTNWSNGTTDAFLLERWEQAGISPAPDAPPEAWLRRAHLVITGLPPSSDEVREWLADPSERQRVKIVERLLASPQFGERWARHWMDLVRYAESYGHEQDFEIPFAWRYRDYLIRGLNQDVSFDQLLAEHIAGDLLEEPRLDPTTGTNESILGTGFWFMHQATHAPVDPVQDESDRIDNQIDVFSKAFLGLTLSCARCHDHKFDPLSMQDYYSIAAILRSARQDIAFLANDSEQTKVAQRLNALHAEQSEWIIDRLRVNSKNWSDEVQRYLMAAREVVAGTSQAQDASHPVLPDLLFEDFEQGFDRWEQEGNAFGQQPTAGGYPGQLPVVGFQGERLANSFHGGDGTQGRLKSIAFTIERNYIHLLVGGGSLSGRARVSLLIDDTEVLRSSGRHDETLEQTVWDVRPWLGKTARIEIIDSDPEGWGHINVDQIVFAQEPTRHRLARPISIVAAEKNLDETRLENWVGELVSRDSRRSDHPLASLIEPTFEAVNLVRAAGSSSPSLRRTQVAADRVELFAEAGGADWFASGPAFVTEAESSPRWKWNSGEFEPVVARIADSSEVDSALPGTLRSPTFTLTHDTLHLRLRGVRGKVRLVICRYELRPQNPLLFGETWFDVDTQGRWEWKQLHADIRRYVGLPAYLELIDHGDGFISLDRVVLSNQGVQPASDPVDSISGEDVSRKAEELGLVMSRGAQAWLSGSSDHSTSVWAWGVKQQLIDWGRADPQWSNEAARFEQLHDQLSDRWDRALVMTRGTAEATHVFVRGNHRQPSELVEGKFVDAIPDVFEPVSDPTLSRLELVRAMTSIRNPLVHRVQVNRIWAHVMGRGIVSTVDNFGAMGEPATHPELLDHMAHDFRAHDGSIKKLIRDLCMSRSFGMSSQTSSSNAEQIDPANRLFHRMPLRRLEGETIRDQLFAVSDSLDQRMAGPSVPTHLTPFMGDPFWLGTRGIKSGPLDGDRRRSVYLEVRRNFLSPWMVTFDFPIPDSTVGQRNQSNVPAQSLALLNDPLVHLQAERCAELLLGRQSLSDEQRINELFLRTVSREPRDDERQTLLGFLTEQRERYAGLGESRVEFRAWTDVCHVVFMQKEFIYVP